MEIFKLIFHHDLLVEQLEGANQNRTIAKANLSLEDFMKPMPTYSRFYLAATQVNTNQFGLSSIVSYPKIVSQLQTLFSDLHFYNGDFSFDSFSEALAQIPLNSGFYGTSSSNIHITNSLNGKEYVREYGKEIKNLIEMGATVFFKIQATHGFDIQIFSLHNWYESLFYTLKNNISTDFRLFSINGKKLSSDRIFYFETYALNNLPHGIEEVFPETTY